MSSKLNCEVLDEDLAFEVRWAVAGDSVVIQLVAKLENREYMSFGLSGNELKSEMIGGDVVVVWVDKNSLKGYAEDYYLDDKSQCSGPKGSCPDERLGERTNSIRLLNAAMVNGYSIVTYQRLQKAADKFDKPIFTNKSQAIIWAVGPLNQRDEVSFHSKYTKGDRFIDFGRPATWNCPSPEEDDPGMKTTTTTTTEVSVVQTEEATTQRTRVQQRRRGGANKQQVVQDNVAKNSDRAVTRTRTRIRTTEAPTTTEEATTKAIPTPAPASTKNPWEIPPIQCYEPEDGVFYAQMGPTGGKSGYPAITGHVGWGISWYINGLLIPEINVVRGKTYTFVVEGGLDSETPAKFHPFYITDDPVGGYEYKTPEEREMVRVFAGVKFEEDGTATPTGIGRLCHWTHQGDLEADDFESFGAYQRTLELKCDQGEPGIIQWTPNQRTPDTVYYQCFTHRYLGWKINVHDSCDFQPEASELEPTIVLPPEQAEAPEDLEDSASVVVESKVAPPPNDIEIPEEPAVQDDKSEDEVEDLKNSLALAQTLTIVKPPRYSMGPPKGYYPPPFYGYKPVFPGYRPEVFRPSPIIFNTDAKRERNETTAEQVSTTKVPTTTASLNTTDSIAEEIKVQAKNAHPPKSPNLTAYVLPLTRLSPTAPEIRYRKPSPMFLTKSHMKYPGIFMFRKPMPIGLPFVKSPSSMPFSMKFQDKPIQLSQMQSQLRPQAVIILKRPPVQVKKPSKTLTFVEAKKQQVKGNPQMHVEISPPQASTEKEPSIITEKPFSYPSTSESLKEIYTLRPIRPAFNTGFRPDSIIVEGGFKPIVSKEILERSDKGGRGPELEYESEIGVIDVRADPLATESFEPMFIPSPTEKQRLATQKQIVAVSKTSHKLKKNTSPFTVIIKHGRQHNFQDHDEEVVETAANERVDTYYLPPANQPPRIQHTNVQPSNIDFNPGILVSYDGKRISGATLTAQVNENGSPIDLTSKASKLLRTTPQFGMYKGDLPPLDRQLININLPQLNSQGILNRDLESPPTDNSRITRLRLIRLDDGRVQRRKREAHHTPEHTAQQESERREAQKNGASSKLGFTNASILIVVSVLMTMIYA